MSTPISTSVSITMLCETTASEQVVNQPYSKIDNVSSIAERDVVSIGAGVTDQDLGATTPATLFGRIVTGLKVFLQTDFPCSLKVTFATGAPDQVIPLTDVLFMTGNVSKILVTTTQATNLTVSIAGLPT